jgi:hypothetical protein
MNRIAVICIAIAGAMVGTSACAAEVSHEARAHDRALHCQALIRAEMAKWAKVIKAAGIRVDQ